MLNCPAFRSASPASRRWDNVSFSARAGEVTGYLGPNGSGKGGDWLRSIWLCSGCWVRRLRMCLAAFRKIPFTCSYLPGKSYLHMAFLTATGLLPFIIRGVVFESEALRNRTIYLWSELSPADRDRLRPDALQ